MPHKKRENREPAAEVAPATPQSEAAQDHPAPRGGGLVVVLTTPEKPEDKRAISNSGASVVDGRMVDRRTQAAIGQQLRAFYNDIATEPVPEHLIKLLEDLEQKTPGSGS